MKLGIEPTTSWVTRDGRDGRHQQATRTGDTGTDIGEKRTSRRTLETRREPRRPEDALVLFRIASRESNPRVNLGKVAGYHYITPARPAGGQLREKSVRAFPLAKQTIPSAQEPVRQDLLARRAREAHAREREHHDPIGEQRSQRWPEFARPRRMSLEE